VLHEVTAGEARLMCLLFPHLAAWISIMPGIWVIRFRSWPGPGLPRWPAGGCGVVSAPVHDRYPRRLQDLACGERPVQVVLEARRFCCGNRRARWRRSPSRCLGSPPGISAAPQGCGTCWRRSRWRWAAVRGPG
jgi:hypothetical protein